MSLPFSAQTNTSLLGLIGVQSEEISSALKVGRCCTCRHNGQFLIFLLFDLQRNQLAFIERHIAGNDPAITKLNWSGFQLTDEVVFVLAAALQVR